MPLDSIAVFSVLDRVTNSDGTPVSEGTVEFYLAGTSTPLTVYSDYGLTSSLGTTASLSLRRKGFSLQLNGGVGSNRFNGNGYSIRQNRYPDSTNRLMTENAFENRSQRPNMRLNLNYDIDDRNHIGFNAQFGNCVTNISLTSIRKLVCFRQ